MNKRPLAVIALFFILGIVLARYLPEMVSGGGCPPALAGEVSPLAEKVWRRSGYRLKKIINMAIDYL